MSNIKLLENGQILIKNVVLSYPHLYEPYAGDSGGKAKFSAKFLLPKATHAEDAKKLLAHLAKSQVEKWKQKLPPTNVCLKDGALVAKNEGDEEFFFLSASESVKPKVLDRDGKTQVPEEDAEDKIFPGAIVNVLINPWLQDNKYGKKNNANLLAVQFVKKGDRLSQGRPEVATDAFEDVSGAFGDDDGFGGGFDD